MCMNRKQTVMCLVLAGFGFFGTARADEATTVGAQAREQVILREDFHAPSAGWSAHSAVTGADGLLLNQPSKQKYSSSLLLFKPLLQIPQEGELRLSLTIGAITQMDTGSTDINGAVRIFLAPEPLPKWPEAYSLPNAMVVWIERHGDRNDMDISLFRKIGQPGMGTLLYSGAVAPGSFPLRFDLWLTRETYRIRFNQAVDTAAGSRSGYHALPWGIWGKDLRFGLRITSHEDKASCLSLTAAEILSVSPQRDMPLAPALPPANQ